MYKRAYKRSEEIEKMAKFIVHNVVNIICPTCGYVMMPYTMVGRSTYFYVDHRANTSGCPNSDKRFRVTIKDNPIEVEYDGSIK